MQYDGKYYKLPLPADRGSGLGKPLQLINHPVRERFPITITALGPKNVALAADIVEGWQPGFFYPEKADAVWGEALRAGFAKRDPALGPPEIMMSASLAIGDDVEERLAWAKPQLRCISEAWARAASDTTCTTARATWRSQRVRQVRSCVTHWR